MIVLRQYKKDCIESQARMAVQVGMHLYGYCCGIFGRDSYGTKVITSIDGNHIGATENRYGRKIHVSGEVDSWYELVSASNYYLDSEDFQGEEE